MDEKLFLMEVRKVKENHSSLYINVILGAAGTILVALAAMSSFSLKNNSSYFMLFFGFIFIINYINYLEKKAGISNKITWIRAIGSIVIFISLGYLLFY